MVRTVRLGMGIMCQKTNRRAGIFFTRSGVLESVKYQLAQKFLVGSN